LLLILFEFSIFWRVKKDLGGARLVGEAELRGSGDIASQGIYGYLRHPRYAGSFLAILGACFLAGTAVAWTLAAAWALLARLAIAFEERELRERFGPAFDDYCRRVPRFVPMRLLFRD
jgi:protein-S-isoprenylcysteine O-methyltransferase Ste14